MSSSHGSPDGTRALHGSIFDGAQSGSPEGARALHGSIFDGAQSGSLDILDTKTLENIIRLLPLEALMKIRLLSRRINTLMRTSPYVIRKNIQPEEAVWWYCIQKNRNIPLIGAPSKLILHYGTDEEVLSFIKKIRYFSLYNIRDFLYDCIALNRQVIFSSLLVEYIGRENKMMLMDRLQRLCTYIITFPSPTFAISFLCIILNTYTSPVYLLDHIDKVLSLQDTLLIPIEFFSSYRYLPVHVLFVLQLRNTTAHVIVGGNPNSLVETLNFFIKKIIETRETLSVYHKFLNNTFVYEQIYTNFSTMFIYKNLFGKSIYPLQYSVVTKKMKDNIQRYLHPL